MLPQSSGVKSKHAEAGGKLWKVESCLAYVSPLKMEVICLINFLTVSRLHSITIQKTGTLHSDCCEIRRSIQVFYFLGNGYRKVVHLLGNGYALDSMAVGS
jgi:hypothetical protein